MSIKVITDEKCQYCNQIKKAKIITYPQEDIEFIDFNQKVAKDFKIDRVPFAVRNNKKCDILIDDDTQEFFIECPED
ncbi:MAG: hypothetical protein AB1349_11685 [Elusimicrobiota bacterium]